jgi:hypothetical protein
MDTLRGSQQVSNTVALEVFMFMALLIFILAYIAIASEKFPRHWVALTGGRC